jgi:hypothetical protein
LGAGFSYVAGLPLANGFLTPRFLQRRRQRAGELKQCCNAGERGGRSIQGTGLRSF